MDLLGFILPAFPRMKPAASARFAFIGEDFTEEV
jgi:hypothetical protein